MALTEREIDTLHGIRPDCIPFRELAAAGEPVVLKGLVADWPSVAQGRESAATAMAYLKAFYNGKTVGTYYGDPAGGGRLTYTDDVRSLNFDKRRARFDEALDAIAVHLDAAEPPSVYIGSATIDAFLPGFRAQNDLGLEDPVFAFEAPQVSMWVGNRSIAPAHYDAPNNLACIIAGRRRFTLFPPDQIYNLYPGPLDPTPGGQAISMVDFDNPDFERYPRFRDAIEAARVAELEPGDAVFYPSMWWHQVESLSPFNVMVNYWWNTSPQYMGTPMNVLKHAMLSLRDRPAHEKKAWRHVFDYYIFGEPERPRAHLPVEAHGELGPIDDLKARRLRAELLQKLNR